MRLKRSKLPGKEGWNHEVGLTMDFKDLFRNACSIREYWHHLSQTQLSFLSYPDKHHGFEQILQSVEYDMIGWSITTCFDVFWRSRNQVHQLILDVFWRARKHGTICPNVLVLFPQSHNNSIKNIEITIRHYLSQLNCFGLSYLDKHHGFDQYCSCWSVQSSLVQSSLV